MSNKRKITYKCPYCDKRFNKEDLVNHIDDIHDDMIPQGYSTFRIVFDYINNKPAGYNGKCIICGKETGWDENKGKYNRLCSNPVCKKKYIQEFEDRMMKSKGVTRISSTADGQAKMLANRKISGEYKFQDGGIKTYTGTYEKKALEFMDKVMNCKSIDISTPGPVLEYDFEGKTHIYISDIYYAPYNLIIEVKDGGNNPNMRSMPEYRAKQIAKEKYIIKYTDYNYLRLTNNDFSQLLAVFMELKMEMSNDTPERVIRINEGNLNYIKESGTVISIYNKKKEIKKLNQDLANKINSTNYPWYFLNIQLLDNGSLIGATLISKVSLYGLDEDPGTDGSRKSPGLFSVANLGNGKLHSLYEKEYKNYHINKSKDIDPALRKFTTYNRGAAKTEDIVLKEEYIEEGFLKSEPDILYNKEAFDNGDINICFITGHSGSGKSTLAHGQESETVEVYELDDLQCIADRFTMANLKEYGDLIYTYFKGPGKQFYTTWDQLKEDMTPGKDYEDKLYPGFVAYAIDWAKKHKDKKYILEGVWLFCNDETGKPYFDPSYFKDYAFYIKGTSAIKSKWRASKRDMKYDQKEESHNRLFWIKSFTKSFFLKNWKWYKFDEKRIQVFRDYFKNKPETVLSEAYTGELGKIQKDPEIIDSYGFISSDGIYNENVKIKGFNKWLRGRSELLIIDKDKVYLKKDPKKGYSIPGGGWEKDEDHNLSAIRETNEEARIKVKNVNYVSSYVAYFPPKDWVKEKISEENWWYGEYIELYIGEYDGQYKGKVEKIDQDKAMESGKFYDIKSIYNDLIPVHQEALNSIINETSISDYTFLDKNYKIIKEDTDVTEAMNALMTGYIPGSVDNPNNVYIVNYMQNNVFSDEDPNEDYIGVSDNVKLTNLIVRDKDGVLKKVDESFLKDREYKVYILEMSKEEVSKRLSDYMNQPVDKNFIYETLIGHKMYTIDQIRFENCLTPVMDYYKYMETFKEICDNYFFARDKEEYPVRENFIPREVKQFNKSGLMYSEKVLNLNEYVNTTKPNKVLENLDVTINN